MSRRLILVAFLVLCGLAGVFSLIKMLMAIFTNPARAWTQAIAFDQLANAAIGGDPDETISSRAYRKASEKVSWKWLQAMLDWIEPGHCREAYESELRRADLMLKAKGE